MTTRRRRSRKDKEKDKKKQKKRQNQKPKKKNKKLFFVHSSKEASARSPTSASLSKKLKPSIQQTGYWADQVIKQQSCNQK
jgi:hypothetical protein